MRDGSPAKNSVPPGLQHAVELGERAVEVRQVMQDGVAEHEVERLVVERQLGGVAGDGLDVQAEPLRIALERGQHPRADVGARGRAHHAGLQQVEREVAGARADLQRAAERPGSRAEQLGELAEHLAVPDLAERDPPLGVIGLGRHVVVAAVDVRISCSVGGAAMAG